MEKIFDCSNPLKCSFFELVTEICPESSFRAPLQRLCSLMRHFKAQTLIRESLEDEAKLEVCLQAWGKQGNRIVKEIKAVRKRCNSQCKIGVERLTFFSMSRQHKSVHSFLKQAATKPHSLLAQAVAIRVHFTSIKKSRPIAYLKECVVTDWSAILHGKQSKIRKSPGLQNPIFLKLRRRFNLNVGKKQFSIGGTFFCQQNTVTNVCAHACVEMMLNNIPPSDGQELHEDDLVSAEQINEFLGIDHRKRAIDCPQIDSGALAPKCQLLRGLREKEITDILSHYGLQPVVIPVDESLISKAKRVPANRHLVYPLEFRDVIYPFIESGNPAILIFETRPSNKKVKLTAKLAEERTRHVVTVFGHTFDIHSWIPSAVAWYARNSSNEPPKALSSQLWADSLLIADDTIGMLVTLPAHTFSVSGYHKCAFNLHPHVVIGAMQRHNATSLMSVVAERMARDAIENLFDKNPLQMPINTKNLYIRRLRDFLRHKRSELLVTRTSAITAKEYCDHLENEIDAHDCKMDSVGIKIIKKKLSKPNSRAKYWMIEFSEPALFTSNISKVGEVLIEMPQGPLKALDNYIKLIRVPEAVFIRSVGQFQSIGGKLFQSHVPLFIRSSSLK